MFQEWTAPQCAQVNFCVFTLAVGQRFSSIVRPVSVNREVDGQRTSKLLIPAPTFAFVTMNDNEQAGAAKNALNGHELNGRALNVNEARPREDRPRPYGAKRSFAGGDRR